MVPAGLFLRLYGGKIDIYLEPLDYTSQTIDYPQPAEGQSSSKFSLYGATHGWQHAVNAAVRSHS